MADGAARAVGKLGHRHINPSPDPRWTRCGSCRSAIGRCVGERWCSGRGISYRGARHGIHSGTPRAEDGVNITFLGIGNVGAPLTALGLDDALAKADVVFLATPFSANETVLRPIADALAGKVLVDCTNPVGPGLTHRLGNEKSGSEFVQSLIPKSRVVKAFSIYGFEPLDVGGLVQAIHLEHMTLMWVRMVRVGGRSPSLVWAALRR